MAAIGDIFTRAGGPLGDILRRGLGPRRPILAGRAVDHPLPPPLLRNPDVPRRLRRTSADLHAGALSWTNLIVAGVNLLYSGRAETAVCLQFPSAAQTRMLLNIYSIVVSFVRADGPWPTEAEIKTCLRHDDGYQPSGRVVVAIGDRGGVPTSAADVPLSEVLAVSHP